jgi:hypothetical protein
MSEFMDIYVYYTKFFLQNGRSPVPSKRSGKPGYYKKEQTVAGEGAGDRFSLLAAPIVLMSGESGFQTIHAS